MRTEILYTINRWEGGDTLVDNPADPGGLTKYGISSRYHPDVDIANLTLEEAIRIYSRDYWTVLNCDAIRLVRARWKLFDMGVNLGTATAAILTQKILGVPIDGIVGMVTVGALNLCGDYELAVKLGFAQARHYGERVVESPANLVFLRGWLNRASDVGDDLILKMEKMK